MTRISFARAMGVAVLAVAAHTGAAVAQGTLPPAKQIVDRYVEAIGGRQMIGRYNARHTQAEMSMPAMGMTMSMDVYQARPNKMFTRIEMPGMGTTTSGFDGHTAWVSNPMQGPRILNGPELNETLSRADFDSNLDPSKNFPTMQTIGEKTIDGHACWNVRMVSATGIEAQNCFDKTTGLLIGSTMKQNTQMGEMQVDVAYSDYQDFDGIKMPTKTTMNMMGQQMVTTIKSVSHAAIPDSTFELPADVKALQH
jgi:hypothetical protein